MFSGGRAEQAQTEEVREVTRLTDRVADQPVMLLLGQDVSKGVLEVSLVEHRTNVGRRESRSSDEPSRQRDLDAPGEGERIASSGHEQRV